jgi:hypothetical protein
VSVRFRWRTYLRAATTEQAVVDLVHTYLASWSTEEIARLPAGIWPSALQSGKDLVQGTLKIGQVHSAFDGSRAALALVQELLLFMTQASVRAVQLMPLPGEVAESMQRSVGGKVLSEEEKKLFEAPPLPASTAEPVRDREKDD